MAVVITGSNTPTAGGITYGDGTTYATTAAGSSGQALLSAGAGAPTWGTPSTSTTATNLAGGSNGTIPYQSASGTTQMLAVGTAGQLLQTNGVGAPSWATVSAGFTLGTPVDSTSGTSIDFTGIPAGTKQIVINFAGVSTNGSSAYLIQIGDSGGVENTDYLSRSVGFASGGTAQFDDRTSGYVNRVNFTNGSATIASGSITLTLENAGTFSWVASGILFNTSANECAFNAGSKSLSAVLDKVRITTVSGTDTFDAGQINIAYI